MKRRQRRSGSACAQPPEGSIGAETTAAGRALIERCRLARRDERLTVLEGLHALKHALRFGATIEAAFSADPARLTRLAEDLTPDIAPRIATLVDIVSPDVFEALAPQAPATGVLSLARRPLIKGDHLLPSAKPAPIVLLEAPAHLGNVGAVIRVAAAAGAAAVVTTGDHDPWDPAALRGSAGLHYAQPVLRLKDLPVMDRPLIAIDPEGDMIDPAGLPARAILAFGSERQGLSATLLERADQRLAIPMTAGVSSLNLATAVGITLYAWRFGTQAR